MNAEDLTILFKEYGNVENVQVMTDSETGRNKGFGFVKMST